ncbi:MAG: M48 family metalloprotease [Halothiobacillaceae bacterium]
MKRHVNRLVFGLLGLSLAWSASAFDLPDMGDSVDRTLSVRDEAELGQEIFAQIRGQAGVIDDPLVAGYLRDLGARLVGATGITRFDFHFEIINDPSINAFAVPGGYIGINTGLILLAEDEAELAGVMAHEIAHGGQRHIARMLSQQGLNSLTALAGLIGAALVGSSSPDAAAAMASAGIAGATQRQINFTRTHENEADRIAIQTLYRAGIDPTGMTRFFQKMLRREIADHPMNQLDYLRTHPLTTARIAGAQARIDSLPGDEHLMRDSLAFQLAQARLAALTDRPVVHQQSDMARAYTQALRLVETRSFEQARPILEALAEQEPGSLWFEIPLARLEHEQGQTEQALERLKELRKLHPTNGALLVIQSDWLVQAGEAQQALKALGRALRDRPEDPLLHLARARAAEAAGDRQLQHESMARHFLALGRPVEAHQEFRTAYAHTAGNPVAQQRIDAAMTKIESQLRPDESD